MMLSCFQAIYVQLFCSFMKLLFPVHQVYAVGAYVEADKAAKELAIRSRGGFFESDQDFCDALLVGSLKCFANVLVDRFSHEEQPNFSDTILGDM